MARIPPPLAFLAAFLAGWLVQRLAWPHAPAPSKLLVALGGTLVGLGAVFTLSAIGLFLANRTTVLPHGQPSRFIARGPYRWTRNPMYLGLSLAYTGAAAWSGEWLAIPLLMLPVAYLSRRVIPMEEARLEAQFGQEYGDYRKRVRRWL